MPTFTDAMEMTMSDKRMKRLKRLRQRQLRYALSLARCGSDRAQREMDEVRRLERVRLLLPIVDIAFPRETH